VFIWLFHKDMFIKNISKLWLLCFLLIASFNAYSIDIITHPSVKTKSLTTAQLRRIYSMRQLFWHSGSPIVVFVLPSKHKLHQKFTKKMLRMFPYQLDRIWNKLTYSGVGTAPIVVDNAHALIDAVMKTTGAIGYIEKAPINNKINIISIKG